MNKKENYASFAFVKYNNKYTSWCFAVFNYIIMCVVLFIFYLFNIIIFLSEKSPTIFFCCLCIGRMCFCDIK